MSLAKSCMIKSTWQCTFAVMLSGCHEEEKVTETIY